MAMKHMKRGLTSFASGKCKMKPYHYTSLRMTKYIYMCIYIYILSTPNANEDVEKLNHSYIADKDVKCMEVRLEKSLKKLNIQL